MFTQKRLRRDWIRARLGIVVLLALTLTTISLVAPSGAAAESPPDHRHGDFDGPSRGQGEDGSTANTSDTGSGTSADTSVASSATSATVTSDLNLRAGPSLDSDILTVMPAGSSVQTNGGPEEGFYPVTFDGMNGYAFGDYLALGGGAAPADSAASDTSVDTTSPAASDSSGDPTSLAGSGETDIVAIIYAAADAYGQSREDMLRVATCESGLDPNNVTPPYDASGLFQFLPSTWASTPFADQDIFDPVASANAAAWMWSVGRRNEWVCQ